MKLYWRWHDSSHSIRRVWREEWYSSDRFEMLSENDFWTLVRFATIFGFQVTEAEDNDA